MAGLVPAVHVLHHRRMLGGYVYILASAPDGVLYVGVTNDLIRRVYEHRNGLIEGFTKKYSIKRLVYLSATKRFKLPSSASTTSSIGRENGKGD
jgi:putative endonuclease